MAEKHSWKYVIDDMVHRNEEGKLKYNRYLTPSVQDDMLQHLYEELLDAAVYIKTEILKKEREEEVNKQLPLDLGDYI